MSGKVGYSFVPFPAELHPLWVGVSTHDMGLCLRLFLLTKGGPYAIHGKDWMGWMCRQMSIHGPERRNIRAALQRYHELGLIRVEASTVTVGFTPDFDVTLTSDRRPTDVALTSHEHRSDVARVVQKDLSVENHSTPKSQIDKIEEIKEERERAGARTHAREATPKAEERAATKPEEVEEVRLSRQPLPEAPPNLPPAERPLAEVIVLEHAREYGKRRAGERPPSDFRAAARIAQWAEDNSEARKTAPRALSLQIVAGLFQSDRAGERRWPLSWAARDPAEFLPPPPGCKPLVATSAEKTDTRGGASHESHREYREPEWMREFERRQAAEARSNAPAPTISDVNPSDFAELNELGRGFLTRFNAIRAEKAAAQ
jgi:hypothetical protein